MALIDVNLYPSKRELNVFGLLLMLFFGLVGGLLAWRAGAWTVSAVLWSIGGVLGLVFYAVRPFRRPMYLAWMYAVYPIGWVVSHLMLGLVYYLVLTPLGLLLRLFGRDALQRKIDRQAPTYWEAHDPAADPARYFRQF